MLVVVLVDCDRVGGATCDRKKVRSSEIDERYPVFEADKTTLTKKKLRSSPCPAGEREKREKKRKNHGRPINVDLSSFPFSFCADDSIPEVRSPNQIDSF